MIREVFLIANFLEGDPKDPSLWRPGYGSDSPQMAWLDRQVREIKSLGRQPWLVIGNNGDEILLKTQAARDLDLIYDTLEATSLWTGLWAAAHGASNAAFVLPIQVPVPDASVWNQLVQQSQLGQDAWYREKVALRPHSNGTWGYPLLLNAVAFKAIAKIPLASLNEVEGLFQPVTMENPTETSAFSQVKSPSDIQR
jgi:hypothetical protein